MKDIVEAYFENIKEKLIQEIEKSEFIIYAAVAWVTDGDILSALMKKIHQGVQVELVINLDERTGNYKSKYDEFTNMGGRLFLYIGDNNSIMHNKFCIIDLSTTITGSFNWSFSASNKHRENIIIERDNQKVAFSFSREFLNLKMGAVHYDGNIMPYGTNAEVLSIEDDADQNLVIVKLKVKNYIFYKLFREEIKNILMPFPKYVYGFVKEESIVIAKKDNGEIFRELVGDSKIEETNIGSFYFTCLDKVLIEYTVES
jgi:phosphatidylserine/phosphatidylglycerophosphate/cardiolipin synthase-like enzyme